MAPEIGPNLDPKNRTPKIKKMTNWGPKIRHTNGPKTWTQKLPQKWTPKNNPKKDPPNWTKKLDPKNGVKHGPQNQT